jgi:hypothetical protein
MISWNPRIETLIETKKPKICLTESEFSTLTKKKTACTWDKTSRCTSYQTGYGVCNKRNKLGFLQFRVVIHIQSLISKGVRWRERKLPLWHDWLDRCCSPTFVLRLDLPKPFIDWLIDSSTTVATQFSGTIITNLKRIQRTPIFFTLRKVS